MKDLWQGIQETAGIGSVHVEHVVWEAVSGLLSRKEDTMVFGDNRRDVTIA